MPRKHKYDRKRCMLVICRRIGSSDKSLDAICDAKPYLPAASTIISWVAEGGSHAEQYAQAKQQQADFIAHQVIDIADTEPNPNTARNRIDARKWYASKLHPAKYGDRLELQGSMDVTTRDVGSLETALAVTALLERIGARQQSNDIPPQLSHKPAAP